MLVMRGFHQVLTKFCVCVSVVPTDLDGQIDYLEQFGSSTVSVFGLMYTFLYIYIFNPLVRASLMRVLVCPCVV